MRYPQGSGRAFHVHTIAGALQPRSIWSSGICWPPSHPSGGLRMSATDDREAASQAPPSQPPPVHHEHKDPAHPVFDAVPTSFPPPIPRRRVQGSDVGSILDSLFAIEAADPSQLTSREVGDALVQLVNVTSARTPKATQARNSLATDPRFHRLLDLLVEVLPSLHGNRVGALLNPLCKLSPQRLPPPVLTALRERLDETMSELSPTNLCTVAFSFCRLQGGVMNDRHVGGQGSVAWWQRFVESAENRLIEFSSWELCQLLRSLLVLQMEHRQHSAPSSGSGGGGGGAAVSTWLTTPAFLDLWVQCASRRLASFSGEELEMLATSFSKIPPFHYRLPFPFLDRLCAAVTEKMEAMGPVLLCRFFHAVSRMAYHPGRDWMALFEDRALGFVRSRKWGQAEHALFLQGCSWLRHQPSDRMLAETLNASKSLLQQGVLTSVNLGTMVVALGELRRTPDEAWMAAFLQACEPLLPSMGSKDLGYILKGLAKLHWHPGDAFMSSLLSLLQPSLPRSCSTELQLLLTALVALNHPPPPEFASILMASVENVRPLPARDLVMILWSLAALDVGPPPDSGAKFYGDMLRRAHNLVHADVASLTTAIQQQQQDEATHANANATKAIEKGANGPSGKLPGRTDKWGLIARLRQLRQVLAHAAMRPELKSAADPTMAELIEEALILCGPDATSMVRAKGVVTPFHTEVRTALEVAGGRLEEDVVVSTFKLDLLLHPTTSSASTQPPQGSGGKKGKQPAGKGGKPQGEMAAGGGGKEGQKLPLLVLLFGPSRFLRNCPDRLEAGTAFKRRVLSAQAGKKYQAVVCVSHHEWASKTGLRAKLELLKAKVAEQGTCSLDDYC